MKFQRYTSLILAAAIPLLCGSIARAGELLLDGTFATTVAIAAGNYSNAVGRSGNAAASYIFTGTTTAGLGWTTDGTNGVFEVWTAGFQGTPSGVGNVLEFADNTSGNNISQTVATTTGGGTVGNVSFGYAARDSGTDAFTASLTDTTKGTTVFTQAFNPTNGLANPITFSRAVTLIPGDSYKLNFLDQNTNGNPISAHINSVSFTQVPEPSTYAFLLGGLGFVFGAWKRRSVIRVSC